MEGCAQLLVAVAYELGLFAAVVFALFGVDDLAVDALFLSGVAHPPREAPEAQTGLSRDFALYIPAWSEGDVIAAMLTHATACWPSRRLTVYVGVYPNDLATMQAVATIAARDRRIRMVINQRSGPTTKGDCLNAIWRRHRADRAAGLVGSGAILLHDAEDVVDPAALATLDLALHSADYAQLPVIPLMSDRQRWIRRHYCDEFAESHGKELAVRASLGAPLPTAGVGCAFRVETLERLLSVDGPFPADSLTEDYELGLRLGSIGAEADFVRAYTTDGRLIASRGLFPERIDTAVRQKTRWLRGNALEGWSRIGWARPPGASFARSFASAWMLWRDRRALLAAAAVLGGYAAILVGLIGWLLGWFSEAPDHVGGPAAWALASCNLALLVWRLAMRGWFSGRVYGWRQGVMAIVRQPVSNIILVMTAWRALLAHWRGLRGQAMVWEKTTHHFPECPGQLA